MTKGFIFSNIAWNPNEDEQVAAILIANAFVGIEIAPSKIWPEPLKSSLQDRILIRNLWHQRKLPILAMQSLLYGKPDLELFGTDSTREALKAHLEGMITLANDLGCETLVFGSPKQRRRNGLSNQDMDRIAIPFFQNLGDFAATKNCKIVIEGNSTHYGCDFLINTHEVDLFLKKVNHSHIQMHLDTGNMVLENEYTDLTFKSLKNKPAHCHISAPDLALVTDKILNPNTKKFFDQLECHLSFEMRRADSGELAIKNIEECSKLKQRYF